MKLLSVLCWSTFLLAQPSWRLTTIAGGNSAGDGAKSIDASIRYLQGLAVDSAGNIYVGDADDHRIRKVDIFGIVTTVAGDGLPGGGADGELANRSRLNTPYGLGVSPLGELVLADLGNARVRRIARDGRIFTIAGGGSKPIPATGQFVPAREVKLTAPRNVLCLPNGSIYISEFAENRILELRPDGGLTTLIGSLAQLRSPAGLALDREGQLLVADSGNARVLRLRKDGRIEIVLAASETVPLERPVGLAVRPDGAILVADSRGDQLWQVDTDGRVSSFPPGGRDVAVDASGNIVTAGGLWLRRLNRLGLTEILIGNAFATFRGDGGPALAARLSKPAGAAADSKGNVYFVDSGNHRIRAISAEGTISTVAGLGEVGFRGDGGPATQAFLNQPQFLAVDAFDNIYFSDSGNHRVRVFQAGGVIQTVAGTGRAEYSNDGLPASQASLASPSGLAFDREGYLYVAERGQHRVRRFLPGGRISTYAGSGIRGIGSNGQDALSASLNAPAGLAVDNVGNLYVADSGNGAIRMVERKTASVKTVASGLRGAEAIAVNAAGALYWTESQRHRVQQLSLAGDTSTIAGRVDENGFNADAGEASAVTLNEPGGLAVLANGIVIVTDKLNDRVRMVEPSAELIAEAVTVFRVVHAATLKEAAAAPGMLMKILMETAAPPPFAEVTVDGFVAPILNAQAGELVFQVPYAVAGRSALVLELRSGGALLFRTGLKSAGAVPGFFELAGERGLVAALAANGRPNHEDNPAFAGDTLQLYGTGEGLLTEQAGNQVPFLPIRVDINGILTQLLYAGPAPSLPGVLQVNMIVPANVRLSGRVPITLRIGGFSNPATQTIVLR